MVPKLTKIHFILLLCFAGTMTFNVPLYFTNAKPNNIFIILLAVNTLVIAIQSKRRPRAALLPMVGLFVGTYLMYVLGLVATDNLHQGFFELEKKVGILIFPLIFLYSPRLSRNQIQTLLLTFSVSCVLTGIVCILIATHRYFTLGEIKYFFYHDLSEIADIHAVYFSMYCCFAIAVLIFVYFDMAQMINRSKKRILFSAVLFLVVLIFLLAGRTHIFLLIIGALALFTFRFYKKNNLIPSVIRAAGIGLFLFAIALLFPTNRERFKQAVNYKNQYALSREWGEQQMRPLIWNCVFEQIARAPIFGTGTGDVQDDLQNCYVRRDYVSLLIWEPIRFNAHNQFLEVAVGLGLMGLLFFLTTIIASWIQAAKQKNGIYLVFLIIFIVSCLTESLLQRFHGIVFFSFFNALLFFDGKEFSVNPFSKHNQH